MLNTRLGAVFREKARKRAPVLDFGCVELRNNPRVMGVAMKIFAPCIGLVVLLAAPSGQTQTLSMGPGMWTVKAKFESADMPPEVTSKLSEKASERGGPRCLKKARDLRTLQSPLANSKSKCEQTDFQLDRDRMTWKLSCSNGMKSVVTVVSPAADNFVATMAMSGPFGKALFVIEGKRVAESCE